MHPILADRKRLALYLLAWILLAILLAILVTEPGGTPLLESLLLTLPPVVVYAFVCLAAWYPTRAMPLRAVSAGSILVTHLVAAMVLAGGWVLLLRVWASVLGAPRVIIDRKALFFVTGVLLYLLAVALHYLLIATEEARLIEVREMEVKMLAREAELKALKAQVDPHFLFNSLNSISSLCASSPSSARTLTTLLAEYLRKSLRLGGAESVTLSEELELASSYLAIERIRFGPRLELEQEVEERVRTHRVPPLLLQPLVENAVTHGIGQLVDGGIVRITAAADDAQVRISVANRCDPDRPPKRGEGIGLTNTKRRVAAFYGSHARVDVREEPHSFEVVLWMPWG